MSSRHIDFDIHGMVGVRLVDPSSGDAAAVTRQLGRMQRPLDREPDILVRFVEHLPTPGLKYVGLDAGFNGDGFYILRSSKRPAKVKIDFSQIGSRCEIVCERGLRSVPLLLAILNLTMLNKDCVSLHASAFVHDGKGIVVTGWAKGGKTEALLSFASRGAEYIGDEWILLRGDGEKMYGIPENIRLWDWHLDNLPGVRKKVKLDKRLIFKTIHFLEALQRKLGRGILNKLLPVKVLREAMPALKRQLNVQLAPEDVFTADFGACVARPEKFFLMLSHESEEVRVEAIQPEEVARRMIESIRFEQSPLWSWYLSYKFAFPDGENEFIEQAHLKQRSILNRALAGKEAFAAYHPYPFSFDDLYREMLPHC